MNQSPQPSMVSASVKEQCVRADEPLFTLRVRRLEQMSMCDQHEPSRLRAGQHHTRATQYIGFEYFTISENYTKFVTLKKEKEKENPQIRARRDHGRNLFCLVRKKILGSCE